MRKLGMAALVIASLAAGLGAKALDATTIKASDAANARAVNGPGVIDNRSAPGLRLAQASSNLANSGNPSVAPLKWVGMLVNPVPTASSPNAVDECTGEFIADNVVLTAGHCIKDLVSSPTGPWYDLTKQFFVLQYQNGEGSQTFHTVCAATPPGWAFPANFASLNDHDQNIALLTASQHDFAMILVDGKSPTGAMPYQLDWKGNYSGATRVGYAGDILEGEIIQQSHGIVFFSDAIPLFPQSFPNIVVQWQSLTDLTQGTSGGAWIANFDPDESPGSNVLLAVTSFGNDDYPGADFGAYLTAAEFNPLLQFVSNGCK